MAGRTCTICSHEKRAEIESEIVSGKSFRGISRHFAVGADSVERHAAEHIAQEVKQSQQAKDDAQAIDVVKQLRDINTITLAILQRAKDDKKSQWVALHAIDRVCKQLELQAKLLGAIDTPQVTIWLTPEWYGIRSTIIAALTPYPDARIAVAGALSQLEDSHVRLN